MKPSVLAIIPARGGSKGIPRKNVYPVAGKPLIAWVLEQCQQSQHLTRTVVSTDDAEIAEVAQQWGADIVWRPAEISGDVATAEEALLHTLEHLRTEEGYEPDYVAYMQCTSALTLVEDIDSAIELSWKEKADTVVPVCDFHYFLWKPGPDGSGVGINHDFQFRPRRQDREPQYLETGAVYILRTAGFLKARHRFFGKIALYHMPLERTQEIDDSIDILRTEFMLRLRKREEQRDRLPDPISALVLDFDGVLTDNLVTVSQTGEESVTCTRADGFGLSAVAAKGIELAVLSTEVNPVVAARCEKLGIPCIHGVDDKLAVLKQWLAERNIAPSQAVFVGNDINDVAAMRYVGCGVAVADAHRAALDVADLVLTKNGGKGAVRELCDLITSRG